MNKRNASVVSAVLSVTLVVAVIVTFSFLDQAKQDSLKRSVDQDTYAVGATKDPSKDIFAQEGIHLAPAPIGPAETVPPVGPVEIDRDLSELKGLTGTFTGWDDLVTIEISHEGYENLLKELGLDSSNPPSDIVLSHYAASTLGYTSDNPEMRFVIVREGY